MNLRTLRYFIAIADAGSLTAAAAAIPIAQPALTRQLRELESEMGVQLLQRMPRGVRLTQAGVTFYESAQRILAESMRLRQRLSHGQHLAQSTVVLGASPTLARVLLPGLLENCFNTLDGIELRTREAFTPALMDWLEKGVIDAAEFVGPFQDRRLGLQKAAKFYYTTGWHEPATVSELLINKAAWDKLPKDLQAIVSNASAACNVISEGWCQKANSDAMEDLKKQGVIARPLPDDVIKALRAETDKVLAEAISKDPLTKKVHDSYFAFKTKFDRWSEVSEEAYHVKVRG